MGKGKSKVPEYPTTTSINPYTSAIVNKNGSSYTLNPFLTSQNTMVENTLPMLYQQLLNPSLDNSITKAKKELFQQTFDAESNREFENNINKLTQRGLIRSSAVNDMINNFNKYKNNEIANFNKTLLVENTQDTANLINILLNQYLLGANLGQTAIANSNTNAQQVNSYNQWKYNQQTNANNAYYSILGNTLGDVLGGMTKTSKSLL